MNRIDRLTAILVQLQSKRVVKAQEIAERFEISLRTVYRDVRALEEAGVPIIGEAGIGYSIMDGYRLPPVMFTREEATTFLMAEKMIENYADSASIERYKSALYKIKAVLRSTEKEFLDDLDTNMLVLASTNSQESAFHSYSIQEILASIHARRVASMVYMAGYQSESQERQIEPIGIYLQGNLWYLIAFCRLRNDYRTFRTDRISQFKMTNERFSAVHPTLHEYLERVTDDTDLHTIVIRVAKSIVRYLGQQKYYFGFVSQVELDDCMELTFLSTSIEGFARWFLMFADQAELVKPESVRTQIQTILDRIVKKLEA
ncbi:MAG: YafY family protein [Spirosomataceae bacterium]